MKLKAKLISTIAAFAMVLCLTIVGVWAASQVSVSLTGTITFTSDHVVATVSLDSVKSGDTSIVDCTSYSATFNSDTEAVSEGQHNATWALPDNLSFDQGKNVVMTFKIDNSLNERAITAIIESKSVLGENTTETIAYGASAGAASTEGAKTSQTIAAGGEAYYVVTVSVKDWNNSANYAANLVITLNNVNG